MTPRRIGQALSKGALGVLPVAATCAAAGVIVGVTTLTGLGLGLAGMIVEARPRSATTRPSRSP